MDPVTLATMLEAAFALTTKHYGFLRQL